MIQSTSEVFAAALSLNINDRGLLAQQLLKSLDEQPSDLTQAEIDAAWVEEIKLRREDIRSGKTKLLDGEEVMARFDELIRQSEASK